ncbi:MAG TPA: ATP-binding protein [Candidatus Polarisedimenticolia bacterium]|jgi:two-component system sensor histidine kinase PilS (NtrC family)
MVQRELQRQTAVLMIGRVVLLTALLGSALLIGRLLRQPLLGSQHFYLLTGAGYALTILYALLHPFWSRHPAAASVQIAGDIILITGVVYVTGGIDSPFSLLYFLPVIASGIMLGRAGALSSATASWVMYAFLVVLIVFGWIPEMPSGTGLGAAPVRVDAMTGGAAVDAAGINKRLAYALFSHFLGFFTVAQLASYLAGKIKTTGEELEENRETLAHVQALNKNIIDSITSGIITTDLSGLITFMNRGAEEITGRRLTAAEGASIEAFLAREEGFFEKVKTNLDRERRFRFDTSLPRVDGSTLYLGFTCAVLKDQRGDPLGYIFSFQDLTEIRALEDEVRLKDRMAALGQMAAGMAHEIRNPLASMSGSVQILRKSLRPTGEEGELLDIVLRESRRLDGIIKDFLLFAKPGRFEPDRVNLAPLLRESLTLLRNTEEFGAKHAIRAEFESDEIVAHVDANMIKQVFWNLAKNGLKAMPQGGVLTVRARSEGRSAAVISFADQGIGMTEAETQRAFQPFHTNFHEGTGLGLSVVFRIVEEHGGRIRVKSRVGEGTEVLVTLPAFRGAARSGRTAPNAAAEAIS